MSENNLISAVLFLALALSLSWGFSTWLALNQMTGNATACVALVQDAQDVSEKAVSVARNATDNYLACHDAFESNLKVVNKCVKEYNELFDKLNAHGGLVQ